ncbi:hypothetical protein LTR78_004566 [Recurvomyces mirabilis]|uniref:Uncharacterized protein n=1 Tax=Recurvomyces mirabilis TaxID=574656 RepID=A0AAE0WPH5_9PEZI|nr:hypothetical protein LTR78_004566 [Recurvomyces mirabilis]KAK5152940.1 hypothetical protein LTS14_008048 [Recurvomyces mirabilis]
MAAALRAMQAALLDPKISSGDDILAATALLAPFEGVMKKSDIPMHSHIEGLAAVLASRPPAFAISQLSRDVLDFHSYDASIMACIQGVPSMLEDVDRGYYAIQPGLSTSGQAQLRAMGIELLIRIPRLVHFAQMLSPSNSSVADVLHQALAYAKELLQLRDTQAENIFLRSISSCPAGMASDTSMNSSSLQYASAKSYEGAAYYWQGPERMQSIRHASLDLVEMEAELARNVQTVVMSMKYASSIRLRQRRRLFAQGLVLLWGLLRDLPHVFHAFPDNEERSLLRNTFLLNVNHALAADPKLTGDDMNKAADLLISVSRTGRFAELFGLFILT